MIGFFTNDGEVIDFSNQRLTLVEESDFFSDNIVRNYSLPFFFYLNSALAKKLGLLNYENIIDYKTRIDGVLLVDTTLHNAFVLIQRITGNRVEAQLQYGKETLPVYAKKLKDLPWPTIVVQDILDHAQSHISKGWPEVGYNFPMIYRPDISEKEDYAAFKNFINHHDGTKFLKNYRNDIEFGETSMIFIFVEDFVQPQTKQVTVNSDNNYTVETDQPWLTVSGSNGINLSTLDVTVNISNLVPLEPSRENKLYYGNVIVKTDSFERKLKVGLQINDTNHSNDQWMGEFPDEEEADIVFNQNVLVPCAYVAEVIRFGFEQEGLKVLGDFFNNNFDTKKLLVPKNYMERFSGDTYDAWSFDYKDDEIPFGLGTVNVYKKTIIPNKIGTYTLKMKINFNSGQAQRFLLTVTLKEPGAGTRTSLFSAGGFKKQINIDETITINVTTENQFDDLVVEMFLTPTDLDISPFNSFVYQLKEGRLNELPNSFTLADYLPDITFGQFMGMVKNASNLDIDPKENVVFFEALGNKIQNLTYIDHTHLQDILPKRTPNFNKVVELKLLDGQRLWVNRSGIIFSIEGIPENDIVKKTLKIFPLPVEENFNVITAKYVEDAKDLRLVLYDGPVGGRPVCVDNVGGRRLTIFDIYEYVFKEWLAFRTSSETYKEKVVAKTSERFDYRIGVKKHNKKHLLKRIKKTRIGLKEWDVETESETL